MYLYLQVHVWKGMRRLSSYKVLPLLPHNCSVLFSISGYCSSSLFCDLLLVNCPSVVLGFIISQPTCYSALNQLLSLFSLVFDGKLLVTGSDGENRNLCSLIF